MAPPTKRRKTDAPTEITFDPTAREEYLTGFHKRKVARKEHARELAIKRDKEEKLRERRQIEKLREKRKEELEEHIKAINTELKKQNDAINGVAATSDTSEGEGDKGTFEGFDDEAAGQPTLPDDDEFVDEDKFTTVTVEAMNGTDDEEELGTEEQQQNAIKSRNSGDSAQPPKKKRIWTKERPKANGKPAQKKRKFRYDSKAERSATRGKQKAKNSKAAKARREG